MEILGGALGGGVSYHCHCLWNFCSGEDGGGNPGRTALLKDPPHHSPLHPSRHSSPAFTAERNIP